MKKRVLSQQESIAHFENEVSDLERHPSNESLEYPTVYTKARYNRKGKKEIGNILKEGPRLQVGNGNLDTLANETFE